MTAHPVPDTLGRPREERGDAGNLELAALVPGAAPTGPTGLAPSELSRRQAVRAVASSIFQEEGAWKRTKRFSAVLLAVKLLQGLVFVFYSQVHKNFSTALEQRNISGFYRGLWVIFLLVLVALPTIAADEFLTLFLQRMLRIDLTMRLSRLYLSSAGGGSAFPFYRLQLTSDIDSPDQRICDDARDVCEFLVKTARDLLESVVLAIGFSAVLCMQAPTIFFFLIAYVVAGTLVVALGFGPRLAFFQNQLVQQEAGLRCQLVRVSESAESIAFFKGGESEWRRLRKAFTVLFEMVQRSVYVSAGLSAFNKCYGIAVLAVVPMLVGPRYLRGEVEFGMITQVNMAFQVLQNALMLIMNKTSLIAKFLVSVRRLHELEAALLSGEHAGDSCIASVADFAPEGPVALRIHGLTLRTPPKTGSLQQTLVAGLSLQLQGGQSLLIAGASGIGKSSLLRAVAGLWSDGGGRIEKQPAKAVFFLPQRPYMFQGSLREQLLYPQVACRTIEDSLIEEALRQVNLGHLLQHHSLADSKEWASMLSPGEQQRISFARALLQRDLQLTLVDEGTSACDPRNEAHLYELLKGLSRSYISVGHRQVLLYHHSHVLWLHRTAPVVGRQGPAACELLLATEFERLHGSTAWAQ